MAAASLNVATQHSCARAVAVAMTYATPRCGWKIRNAWSSCDVCGRATWWVVHPTSGMMTVGHTTPSPSTAKVVDVQHRPLQDGVDTEEFGVLEGR
eukprot:CAMPEP_0175917236 /NCGR_PEP_ID=MMETSP0108-20121206/11257_1 /TAXON_ID=195067 ORGANISM="Goniomonas pacifica, Strain CCMP1869" /NCGR_SAMPLE_ID=MMETSP0108 /ASSEMBLY_ACC=CAM_ASM_000204 /LENGTH=95 /DNA_ID=CAMNT_0017239811 /DNA_START=100 /DNA_END=388 /DNA_ORIENTATION=+